MRELLDIVDPSGNPLGRAKLRQAVHRDGDWHRTVHVWIVNKKGELLFQKRSADRESFPGTWDVSSAGHVSSGELPVEAAKKELFEELGIRAAHHELHPLFSVTMSSVQHNGLFIDNEISEVFLFRKNISIAHLSLQRSEVTEARYFPVSILDRIAEFPDPAFAPHPEEYHLLYQYLSKV
jgi:isopentenyl-diphosphate delta-isomerase type 1